MFYGLKRIVTEWSDNHLSIYIGIIKKSRYHLQKRKKNISLENQVCCIFASTTAKRKKHVLILFKKEKKKVFSNWSPEGSWVLRCGRPTHLQSETKFLPVFILHNSYINDLFLVEKKKKLSKFMYLVPNETGHFSSPASWDFVFDSEFISSNWTMFRRQKNDAKAVGM